MRVGGGGVVRGKPVMAGGKRDWRRGGVDRGMTLSVGEGGG